MGNWRLQLYAMNTQPGNQAYIQYYDDQGNPTHSQTNEARLLTAPAGAGGKLLLPTHQAEIRASRGNFTWAGNKAGFMQRVDGGKELNSGYYAVTDAWRRATGIQPPSLPALTPIPEGLLTTAQGKDEDDDETPQRQVER